MGVVLKTVLAKKLLTKLRPAQKFAAIRKGRVVRGKVRRLRRLGKAAAVAAVALPFAMIAPERPGKRMSAPFLGVNYAHRGLHSEDKSVPENSLEAFRLAAEAGYGIELDVQLSRDGQVVVFHDDTLDRVCGVSGRVDDYSFTELQKLSLCGTEQRIPLLVDVLATIAGRSPLIVELKTGRHNPELCKKTYELLSDYDGDVCVESFDPLIVLWFRMFGRDLMRGQLAAEKEDYEKYMNPVLSAALSKCFFNFLGRPHFIAYHIGHEPLTAKLSMKMGALNIGWTSHDPSSEKGRDGVIFEFYRPKRRYK